MYRIIDTTDKRFLGIQVSDLPKIGDILYLKDFVFYVQSVFRLENNIYVLIDTNYIIYIKEE